MIDFNEFSTEVFQILRAYGKDIVLYDSDGTRVFEPKDARRMYVIDDNILVSILEDGPNSAVRLYLSPSLNLSQVSGFLMTLRRISTQSNLLFHVKKYNKEIKPKDFATMASVNEGVKMDIMEGLYGTSKSSYLKLENARMIVRHGARIKEHVIGDRGRNIDSIFVENSQGERFKFPVTMLSGARAMTQHVNNGGTFADDVGSQIIRMAQDFKNLAQVTTHIQGSLSEAAKKPKEPKVEAYGVKGMKSTKWRKIFKNAAALNQWCDANGADVHGQSNIDEPLTTVDESLLKLRTAIFEQMKSCKRSFSRVYNDATYVRESESIVATSALMEGSDSLSESIETLTALLGEGCDSTAILSVARLIPLSVLTAQTMVEDVACDFVSEDDDGHLSMDEYVFKVANFFWNEHKDGIGDTNDGEYESIEEHILAKMERYSDKLPNLDLLDSNTVYDYKEAAADAVYGMFFRDEPLPKNPISGSSAVDEDFSASPQVGDEITVTVPGKYLGKTGTIVSIPTDTATGMYRVEIDGKRLETRITSFKKVTSENTVNITVDGEDCTDCPNNDVIHEFNNWLESFDPEAMFANVGEDARPIGATSSNAVGVPQYEVYGIIGLNNIFTKKFQTEYDRDEWISANSHRVEITGTKDPVTAVSENNTSKLNIEDVTDEGWYAVDMHGFVVEGPKAKKDMISWKYLEDVDQYDVMYVSDDVVGVDEGKSFKRNKDDDADQQKKDDRERRNAKNQPVSEHRTMDPSAGETVKMVKGEFAGELGKLSVVPDSSRKFSGTYVVVVGENRLYVQYGDFHRMPPESTIAEAQSPAQKAAFAKMLAAKKGKSPKKDDSTVDETFRVGSDGYNKAKRLASSNIDRTAEEKRKAKEEKAKSDKAALLAKAKKDGVDITEGAVKGMIDDVTKPGWYAVDSKGVVVEGPKDAKTDISVKYRNADGAEYSIIHITEDDLDTDLNEAVEKAEKRYRVTKVNSRNDRSSNQDGTLAELIDSYSYTLETGASYAHEKGNKKINRKPTTIAGLITNLNNAVNNSAANGYAGVTYSAKVLPNHSIAESSGSEDTMDSCIEIATAADPEDCIDVTVTYRYSAGTTGTPSTRYSSNGDPGEEGDYGDPEEVAILKVERKDTGEDITALATDEDKARFTEECLEMIEHARRKNAHNYDRSGREYGDVDEPDDLYDDVNDDAGVVIPRDQQADFEDDVTVGGSKGEHQSASYIARLKALAGLK